MYNIETFVKENAFKYVNHPHYIYLYIIILFKARYNYERRGFIIQNKLFVNINLFISIYVCECKTKGDI